MGPSDVIVDKEGPWSQKDWEALFLYLISNLPFLFCHVFSDVLHFAQFFLVLHTPLFQTTAFQMHFHSVAAPCQLPLEMDTVFFIVVRYGFYSRILLFFIY